MALKKRVEILFEEDKFTYLEDLARREKTSVGSLIREAVEKVYLADDLEERREAVNWLTSQNVDFGGDWEDIKKELIGERYKQTMKAVDKDVLQ